MEFHPKDWNDNRVASEGTNNDIFENVTDKNSENTYSWALSDFGWSENQNAGRYSVHLNGYGTEHFTVTPEPASSLLFLIGGAFFLAFRKKKGKLNKLHI